jgi:uncharacterized BrkB/YihY/UPF0761 family membrane protein
MKFSIKFSSAVKSAGVALLPFFAPLALAATPAGFDQLGTQLCDFLSYFTGSKSAFLAILIMAMFAVFMYLWWVNENKTGPLSWVLMAGVVVTLLINIAQVPGWFGMTVTVCKP